MRPQFWPSATSEVTSKVTCLNLLQLLSCPQANFGFPGSKGADKQTNKQTKKPRKQQTFTLNIAYIFITLLLCPSNAALPNAGPPLSPYVLVKMVQLQKKYFFLFLKNTGHSEDGAAWRQNMSSSLKSWSLSPVLNFSAKKSKKENFLLFFSCVFSHTIPWASPPGVARQSLHRLDNAYGKNANVILWNLYPPTSPPQKINK